MSLDFSPFDAELLPHGNDLTLLFQDNSVMVFHHVREAGQPVSAALRLPDGSTISLCTLLKAIPRKPENENGAKIPQLKIPGDDIPPTKPAGP